LSEAEVKQNVRAVLDIEPPKDFKLIYLNDNVTTFEFVTESLINVFAYDQDGAAEKAMEINDTGASVVAIMPFEIAEQKGVEVLMSARNQGYPLEVKLESE
jgi:ATP-dependent Clp protease adaptor protein ClpS